MVDLVCRAGGLTRSQRVIEIGVGTGRIALPLSERVRSVVGVDLARRMMERLRAKQSGQPVMLAQADATHLPVASGVFDAAVTVHVFHLISNYLDALAELARALRPGGVLLNGWSANGYSELRQAFNDAVSAPEWRNVGVQRGEYNTFLPQHGWQQVGDIASYEYVIHRAPQTYIESLEKRRWSGTWRLPEAALQKGIAAVREAALRLYGDLETPVPVVGQFSLQVCRPPAA